jgi:hypothetical protein
LTGGKDCGIRRERNSRGFVQRVRPRGIVLPKDFSVMMFVILCE